MTVAAKAMKIAGVAPLCHQSRRDSDAAIQVLPKITTRVGRSTSNPEMALWLHRWKRHLVFPSVQARMDDHHRLSKTYPTGLIELANLNA
jgi:hypothetical protein